MNSSRDCIVSLAREFKVNASGNAWSHDSIARGTGSCGPEIGCFARHLVQFFSGGTQRKKTFQMLTWAKPGGGKANAFMGISIGGCLVCTWHG